jgi:putative addiction module killer protein
VKQGIFEARIDYGPGYRTYFGKDGATVVILVGGGSRKKQQDIKAAQARWRDDNARNKKKGD